MDTKTIIFPASRSINHEEKLDIFMKIKDFLTSWKTHGNPLQSNVCIEYEQFFIHIQYFSNARFTFFKVLCKVYCFVIYIFKIFESVKK